MAGYSELLSFMDSPVFRLYATYAAVVTLKMMFLSAWTAKFRLSQKVFINPEDAPAGKKELVRRHDDVERVRRCHRNDLENIVPFLVLGLLYVLTGPSVYAAAWHFRAFVASRFAYMVCYLLPLPQPTRFLACLVGYGVNVSLAAQVIMNGQLWVLGGFSFGLGIKIMSRGGQVRCRRGNGANRHVQFPIFEGYDELPFCVI
ncbi:microsomal glutathione S-transferase 1-like [Patiria miniata]|uniref:Microsomal glutathione S-transferase 1 n=1 Tax=Patiria miniata TaxID=46514 RepID=A0A914B0C7_PATMI|nr:microsomal glutathione S-transferase 1-like [Patiria miniata]